MRKAAIVSGTLVVAAVLLAWLQARAGWSTLPPARAAAEVLGGAAPASDEDVPLVPVTGESPQRGVRRHAVAEGATPGAHSWLLEVLVCDVRGRPVADAEVGVWDAAVVEGTLLMMAWQGQHATLRTDAGGRCAQQLDGHAFAVAARHAGGSQSAFAVAQAGAEARCDMTLLLLPKVTVHGIVLGEQDAPVAGAEVQASRSPGVVEFLDRAAVPLGDAVVSGDDGRFSLVAHEGSRIRVAASSGARSTFPREVVVPIGDPPPLVVLRMRGSISIAGIVHDEHGQPAVDAAVSATNEEGKVFHAFTVHGRFRVDVPDYVPYELRATATGRGRSATVSAHPRPDTPPVEVSLRLTELARIAGRVVDRDGRPMPQVEVAAQPAAMRMADALHVASSSLMENSVRTSQDGTFTLRVDPGTSWCLRASEPHGSPSAQTCVDEVAPGTGGLLIVLGGPGATVRGSVARRDGRQVGAFSVRTVATSAGWTGEDVYDRKIDGSRFLLQTATRGARFWVRVESEDPALAPAMLGPFVAEGQELELDVRLGSWGELPVRVVDRDGWPVFAARVRFAPTAAGGFLPNASGDVGRAMATDVDGRTTLTRCVPGPGRVVVSRPGVASTTIDVGVVAGPNPLVLVRLP